MSGKGYTRTSSTRTSDGELTGDRRRHQRETARHKPKVVASVSINRQALAISPGDRRIQFLCLARGPPILADFPPLEWSALLAATAQRWF